MSTIKCTDDAVTLFRIVDLDDKIASAMQTGFHLFINTDVGNVHGWIIHDNGVEAHVVGEDVDADELYAELKEKYRLALVDYFVWEAVNVQSETAI